MGSSVATGMNDASMFAVATANPVEAFRLSAMVVMGGSLDGALDRSGPTQSTRFGDNVTWVTVFALAAWTIIPVTIGAVIFRRGPQR